MKTCYLWESDHRHRIRQYTQAPAKSRVTSEIFPSLANIAMFSSLNYIKQLRLKDDLRWTRGFSMETLCPHEYSIPL